jgi:LysR family transcriptional activator of nhaA
MKILIDGKPIWVNYHHLYCFYSIARFGSITLAAKSLGIGQSALSIQMQQFESQLGFVLFERSHRKIAVNERGRIVMSYAKEIFRIGGEMVHTLHDRTISDQVHLQIGALDSVPKHLTVQLVQMAANQGGAITVVEGKPKDLIKNLAEHRLDLVVSNFQPRSNAGKIYTKCIARLPLWIVGSSKFVRLRKDFPKSLGGQPFVVPTTDSSIRHEFENFCVKNHLSVNSFVETQDIMVQKLLAVQHLGLSIMPEFAVKDFLRRKELHLIGKLPNIFEEIFLIAARRKIENPTATYLMRHFEVS